MYAARQSWAGMTINCTLHRNGIWKTCSSNSFTYQHCGGMGKEYCCVWRGTALPFPQKAILCFLRWSKVDQYWDAVEFLRTIFLFNPVLL